MRSKKDLDMTASIIRLALVIFCIIYYFVQTPSGMSSEMTLSQAKKYFSPDIFSKIEAYMGSKEIEGGVKIAGDEKIIDKGQLIEYLKDNDMIYSQYASFYNYKNLFNLGIMALIYTIVILVLSRSVYHPMLSLSIAIVDFALCTLFIFWTGGIRGGFIFLYFMPLIYVSLQFGVIPSAGTALFTIIVIYILSNFIGFLGVDPLKDFATVFRLLIPMGITMALSGSLGGFFSQLYTPLEEETHIVVDEKEQKLENVTRQYHDQSRKLQQYQTMELEYIKKKREIYDLGEIIREIVSEVNISKLFNLVMDKAVSQCNAHVGAILMITNQGDLRTVAKNNLSPISEKLFSTRVGEGIPGMVAMKKETVLMSKEEDPAFAFFARCPERIKNCLCAPIAHREKVKGVIILCNKLNDDAFTLDDKFSIENIAGMAANAISNAEMFREIQRSYDKLELANKALDEKNKQLANSIEDTIKTLAEALDAKDEYTRGHTERVAKYSMALARYMVETGKLPPQELERVRRGSLLHDIGKIGIHDKVLLKPEGLTDEEFEQIKKHVTEGARIISKVPSLAGLIDIVKYHHEKFDGTGYPDGLKGNEIPLAARIVAVADTFDAMTTDRPYRKGFLPEVAIEKMSKFASKQFGVDIFQEFAAVAKKTAYFRNI